MATLFEGTMEIDSKWTDAEGNIWYKVFGTNTTGESKGHKWQELCKLTQSGTILESVSSLLGTGEFDPSNYPRRIEREEPSYQIFYRLGAMQSYVAKPNEELYGTWTNERYPKNDWSHPQKVVYSAGRVEHYYGISDSAPFQTTTLGIDAKWTDSEGNIWYKYFVTVTGGLGTGYSAQALSKLSKSGTVFERQTNNFFGADFSPSNYPTKIDPESYYYRILYRAKK